jgi:hypothetical protein
LAIGFFETTVLVRFAGAFLLKRAICHVKVINIGDEVPWQQAGMALPARLVETGRPI